MTKKYITAAGLSLVFSLYCLLLGSAALAATDVVGHVSELFGEVNASSATGKRRLDEGSPLYAGDTITTPTYAVVNIGMIDGGKWEIDDASLEIIAYVPRGSQEYDEGKRSKYRVISGRLKLSEDAEAGHGAIVEFQGYELELIGTEILFVLNEGKSIGVFYVEKGSVIIKVGRKLLRLIKGSKLQKDDKENVYVSENKRIFYHYNKDGGKRDLTAADAEKLLEIAYQLMVVDGYFLYSLSEKRRLYIQLEELPDPFAPDKCTVFDKE